LSLPSAPFSVSVNRNDGSAWVALASALQKYSSALSLQHSRPASGWSVAVDQGDGSVWHAERNGTVTHMDGTGGELLVIPGAAGDPLRDAWLALGVVP
jgi:streptogramin lyase